MKTNMWMSDSLWNSENIFLLFSFPEGPEDLALEDGGGLEGPEDLALEEGGGLEGPGDIALEEGGRPCTALMIEEGGRPRGTGDIACLGGLGEGGVGSV